VIEQIGGHLHATSQLELFRSLLHVDEVCLLPTPNWPLLFLAERVYSRQVSSTLPGRLVVVELFKGLIRADTVQVSYRTAA
jgi:hypothetical protein